MPRGSPFTFHTRRLYDGILALPNGMQFVTTGSKFQSSIQCLLDLVQSQWTVSTAKNGSGLWSLGGQVHKGRSRQSKAGDNTFFSCLAQSTEQIGNDTASISVENISSYP